MPDKRSVLLVVEGEKQEPLLLSRLFELYGLDASYEIFTYGTNLYELYERMFDAEDPETLSLLGVLKERESGKRHPDEKLLRMLDKDFSDILLVFDFERQDNRFSYERLATMLKHFSESTDEGKLYINYPMVEACRHFAYLPDGGFFARTVAVEDTARYKKIVSEESRYQSFVRDFSRDVADAVIVATGAKALKLCGEEFSSSNLEEILSRIDALEILVKERCLEEELCVISVLGTCLLFIIDYSTGLIDFARACELAGVN